MWRVVITLLFFKSALSYNAEYSIINYIGDYLPANTLVFDRKEAKGLFYLAKFLALNKKYVIFVDDLITDSRHQSLYIVHTFYNFWWKMVNNKTYAAKNWITLKSFDTSFINKLHDFNGHLFNFDKKSGLLTTIFKACVGCALTAEYKTIIPGEEHMNIANLVRRTDLNLSDSTITVSLDKLNKCGAESMFDPFFKIQCFHIEIIETLAFAANFNTVFLAPLDPRILYNFPTGDLFTELFSTVVDVSAGSFVVTEERMGRMSFVWPTYQLKGVMFIKEKRLVIDWMAYFFPLSMEVWLCLSLSAIVAGNALHIIMHKKVVNKSIAMHEPFFQAFQTVCSQAVHEIPMMLSCKIVYISLLLTAIVILPSYSGSIISFLTVHPVTAQFITLQQFLDDSRYKILTRKNHFIDQRLRATIGFDLPEAIVGLEERAETEKEGFNKICEDWLTYVIEQDIYRPSTEFYDCEIQQLPFTVMFEYIGLALPKKSIFIEYLSKWNLLVRSYGVTNRLKELTFRQTPGSPLSRKFDGVTFTDIVPILMFLFMVILISFIILYYEKLLFTVYARNNGI